MGLLEHRSSAAAGGPVNGVDGSVYRPKQTYISPSHNSKTVLCIVKIGPLTRFYPEFHLLTWLWQCMRPYMKDVIVGTNMLKYVENSTAGTLLIGRVRTEGNASYM